MDEKELQAKMLMLGILGIITGKVNPRTVRLDTLRETYDLVNDVETFINEHSSSEMAKLPILATISLLRKETTIALNKEEEKHKCQE